MARGGSARGNADDDDADEGTGRVRLDKWLWAARFFKTRSIAADAVEAGRVDVNGDRAKRSRVLQVGDEVCIRQGPYQQVLHVRELSAKRGGAPIAQTLYAETEESRVARAKLSEQMRAADGGWEKGKPTKQDRRAIDKWRNR